MRCWQSILSRLGKRALCAFFLWLVAPLEAENSGTTNATPFSIRHGKTGISITYSGTLQKADSLLGPWKDISVDNSPYEAVPSETQGFYRRIESEGLFASDSIVDLTLTGPFQQHFDFAFAGIPDGIFPPTRDKPFFDGQIEFKERTIPVRLRVRGNSSLQECPFPKLKVKISRSNREGTPFENAREWKIGTHCAEGGRGTIGRLRDERTAYREALVYEVMIDLDMVGPRVRRARILYHDTSPGTEDPRVGWQLTRKAFVFDHVEIVAERLGGQALEDEEVASLVNANFDEQLVTDLMLFHTLIGNWDYHLSPDGQGLWNTEVIRLADGSLIPVAGDFDLSSWVTGQIRVTAPRDYLPTEPDLDRQIRFELERISALAGPIRFNQGRERFTQIEEQIINRLCSSVIDEDGSIAITEQVTQFFKLLKEMK